MTAGTTSAVAAHLLDARARTEILTAIPDAELTAQHSPLMSPLVWDLAHIGMQEEFFLLRGVVGRAPLLPPAVEQLYDAFRHPRAGRVTLPLLSPVEARDYNRRIRDLVLDLALDHDGAAFPAALVAQHELQHIETMLATHQLREGIPLLGPGGIPGGARRRRGSEAVLVPAGPCVIGADPATEPDSLDNERGAHVVEVPAFRIGRVPVTNGEWSQFMADGGYEREALWSPAGWEHRRDAGLDRPLFWSVDGSRRRFGIVEEIPADEPVQHICYWEAEAFARWAGARLPSEIEWEKACAWDPTQQRRRRWPWGEAAPDADVANVDGVALRPAPAGSLPAGASAYGVEQLIGDVWEWTSSTLRPWPGFTPMVYATYSEPFFGPDYRVLRGGSWATGVPAVRPSFRNWDLPQRRQIFTGLRLAWDA